MTIPDFKGSQFRDGFTGILRGEVAVNCCSRCPTRSSTCRPYIRMPNGALASLRNIDPHHRVAIADLILVQSAVRSTVERLVHDLQPDLVGLSVMTFQRATALKIARLVHALRPAARIVVGGYDPSLAPEAYESGPDVDFIVRGEGEHTLCELLRVFEGGGAYQAIAGLSYRTPAGFLHNATRPVIRLPRVHSGCPGAPRACSAVTPCSDARWTSSKPRAAARSTAASVRSSKCGAATSTPIRSTGSLPTSPTPARTAPKRSFSSTTTSRSTSRASKPCATRSSTRGSTMSTTRAAITAPLGYGATRALMRQAGFRYVFPGIRTFGRGPGSPRAAPAPARPGGRSAARHRTSRASAPAHQHRSQRPHRQERTTHANRSNRSGIAGATWTTSSIHAMPGTPVTAGSAHAADRR